MEDIKNQRDVSDEIVVSRNSYTTLDDTTQSVACISNLSKTVIVSDVVMVSGTKKHQVMFQVNKDKICIDALVTNLG